MATQPLRSVRTLTLVKNARFNNQVSEAMKEYTHHNKPYVLIAAVVGLSGLQEILYNVVISSRGEKSRPFRTSKRPRNFSLNYHE